MPDSVPGMRKMSVNETSSHSYGVDVQGGEDEQ